MAIELVTKFSSLVDEKFKAESKLSLMTNQNYDWVGAKTVKVYTVSTADEVDYTRNCEGLERFGVPKDLEATTQEMTLTQDKAFTFAIDKMDADETAQALQAAKALERQLRERTIPSIDTYAFGKMVEGAGTKAAAAELTKENVMDAIMDANRALDNAEVPETGRFIIVTPDLYMIMKQSRDIILETEVGAEMRKQGAVAMIDGVTVVKVPQNRLPEGFGFLVGHPCATVAPTKLADYRVHNDPVGLSGDLVEGRTVYDAFVIKNKAKALYYHALV